jgi:hypothetical protein
MNSRKIQRSVDYFLSRSFSQSDDEFIKICFQDFSNEKIKVAIGIRHAIAELGSIEPEYIRGELSFEELDSLPFWRLCGDAGFDTGILINSIEKNLGIKFTERQLELAHVRDPDLNISMKIYEFIQEFYDWYKSLKSLKNNQ